jgi:hypothetical protein
MSESPIVCTLGPDALKVRKAGLLARVARVSTGTVRIEAGYRFEFTADTEALSLIADMIDAERSHDCALTVRISSRHGGLPGLREPELYRGSTYL